VISSQVGLRKPGPAAAGQPGNAYHHTNLVSDLPGLPQLTDPDLVNPWGMAAGPTTPAWVADNGTDRATIYPGFVGGSPITKAGLMVNIPGGAPTGQVFNPTAGFVVRSGDASGSARFIFDSEAGLVTGWNPGVPPPSTQAQVGAGVPDASTRAWPSPTVAARRSCTPRTSTNARIDVFDQGFDLVHLAGSFTDPAIPPGFAPFNVQEVGGLLYVAYARQDAEAEAEDEVAGPALGFVDVYSTSGQLLRHLIEHGQLNAPWGLVLAPAGFGRFAGALLVGNFGNGRINAYNPTTGEFLGRLRHEDGSPIEIEGLWALRFGNESPATRPPCCSPPASTTRPTACSAPSKRQADRPLAASPPGPVPAVVPAAPDPTEAAVRPGPAQPSGCYPLR
jgi:uncharacterized protein (TIGR03118 family)